MHNVDLLTQKRHTLRVGCSQPIKLILGETERTYRKRGHFDKLAKALSGLSVEIENTFGEF